MRNIKKRIFVKNDSLLNLESENGPKNGRHSGTQRGESKKQCFNLNKINDYKPLLKLTVDFLPVKFSKD